MKKCSILFLLTFIVTLSGCAVKETFALECVTDNLVSQSIPAYYMSADIPHGTFLSDSCKEGCCALYTHEDYEVMQEIFLAENLDEALMYLTGKSAKELRPIKIKDFPRDEYRFVWNSLGEKGDLVCSGMLFSDGTYYYSLCIFCEAEAQKYHTKDFARIFSGTELIAL